MTDAQKRRSVIAGIFTLLAGAMFAPTIQAVELNFGKSSIDIHGFFSQGYLHSDHNNFLAETEDGTCDFREYGVNAASELTTQLYIGAQLFGRKFGDYGNDDITLDWALADYHFQDWIGIRAGRMKAVLGLYNETRDIDMLRTSIFLPESIYNDAWRESFTALDGAGIYGTLSYKSLGSLSYQAQWGKIYIESDGGVADYIAERVPMDVHDIETSDVYIVGIEWTPAAPFDGLRLRWTWNTWEGVLAASTNAHLFWQNQGVPAGLPISYHADVNMATLSVEYRWDNLLLAAETFLPDNFNYRMESPVLGHLAGGPAGMVGYYGSAAYRVGEWLEFGMYYSEYYNNGNDKDGKTNSALTGNPLYNSWLKDIALTTRFDIHDNWVVKVEGHFMNGTDLMLTKDNPDGTHEDWFLFGCKVAYSF